MKKIVLTEEELKEVVRGATQQVLMEMAEPLKKYAKRIESIRFQLAENWCLCKYCQFTTVPLKWTNRSLK